MEISPELQDYDYWLSQGLVDSDNHFKTILKQLCQFPSIKDRIAILQRLQRKLKTHLDSKWTKKKAPLRSMKTQVDAMLTMIGEFKLEKVNPSILVNNPHPEKVKYIEKLSLAQAELKRIFFSENFGMVQFVERQKPHRLQTKIANTFKSGTNIIDRNKLIICADGSMYLLDPSDDELTLTCGKTIFFCGEIIIKQGKINYLNNFSTVYPMRELKLRNVMAFFKRQKIPTADIALYKKVLEEEKAIKLYVRNEEKFKKWSCRLPILKPPDRKFRAVSALMLIPVRLITKSPYLVHEAESELDKTAKKILSYRINR